MLKLEEVIMNKKIKKSVASLLALTLCSGFFITADGKTTTQNIKVNYQDIQVTYNGKTITPNNEPFAYNNSTYVSVRDIGEMTGNIVNWDSATRTINITPNSSNTDYSLTSSQLIELATLKNENLTLQQKVNDLQKKLAVYEGDGNFSSITSSQLTKVLNTLSSNYDSKYSVSWNYDLEKGSNKLLFTIEYRGSRYQDEFENISQTRLESFIKTLCQEITGALGTYAIEGEIVNTTTDEAVVDFTYSTAGKLSVENVVSSTSALRSYASTLKTKYPTLALSKTAGGYDEISLGSINLSYYTSSVMEFEVYLNLSTSEANAWNTYVKAYSTYTDLDEYLYDISNALVKKFGVSRADGYVYGDGDTIIAKFLDGRLTAVKSY
jgi:hypothetical protein